MPGRAYDNWYKKRLKQVGANSRNKFVCYLLTQNLQTGSVGRKFVLVCVKEKNNTFLRQNSPLKRILKYHSSGPGPG